MTDPAQQFIGTVVDPLRDNAELQMAGREQLTEAMAIAGEADAQTLEYADQQLIRFDQCGWRHHWRWALTIFALGLFAAVAVFGSVYAWRLKSNLWTISALRSPSMGMAGMESNMGKTHLELSQSERLLLFGDPSQPSASQRWKALWDSDPKRPDFFIEYTLAYLDDHKDLPPNFLETGARLDPGNGWFPAVAAAVYADQATEPIPRTEAEKRSKMPVKYRLIDSAKLRQGLACFETAAAMPRFDSHRRSLMEARIRLLPKRTDTVDQAYGIAYMASTNCPWMPLRKLPGLLHVECERILRENDRVAFGRLAQSWQTFALHYADSDDLTLIDGLIKRLVLHGGYQAIATGAKSLEAEETARLETILGRFDEHRKVTNDRPSREGIIEDRGSFLAAMLLSSSLFRSTVTELQVRDEDLKPGRMADHELVAKILAAWLAVSMLLHAGVVALYRFRGGMLRRQLSARLIGALGPVDWLWILGFGSLAPFAAMELVSHLPILGAREWAINVTGYYSSVGLFFVGTWLMVLLPVLIARWRLERSIGFLGFQWTRRWLGWALAGLLISVLPFAAVALLSGNRWELARTIVIVAPSIWAIVAASTALFSRKGPLLKRLTLSRALVPPYLLSALLASLAVFASHGLEKQWMKHERFIEITPEQPATSGFEYRVTRVLRDEIREILQTP